VDSRWNGTYVVLQDGDPLDCPGLMQSRLSVMSYDRSVPVPDLKRGGPLKVHWGRDALEPGSMADNFFSSQVGTSEFMEHLPGMVVKSRVFKNTHVSVPYWELILTYLCCWVALLGWRVRRWRKMVEAMEAVAEDR
jgi:hypothetical protein